MDQCLTWPPRCSRDSRHEILPSTFSIGGPFANAGLAKGLADWKRDSDRLVNVIKLLEADRKACLNEIATLAKLRKEAVQQRGQMLLDHGVCSELDFD